MASTDALMDEKVELVCFHLERTWRTYRGSKTMEHLVELTGQSRAQLEPVLQEAFNRGLITIDNSRKPYVYTLRSKL